MLNLRIQSSPSTRMQSSCITLLLPTITMLTLSFISRTSAFSFTARTRLSTPKMKRHMTRSTITMMPEGPEVKTLVDQLQPAIGMRLVDFRFVSGRYVRHGRPGGFMEFAKTMTPVAASGDSEIDGSEVDIITSLKCKGKFIYLILDNGQNNSNTATADNDDYQRSIWITLGMTGQFVNEDRINDASSEPRWYMELMDVTTHKRRRIYYRDARNFGTLKFILSKKELDDKLDTLGADLLDEGTTEEVFLELMDKSVQNRNICKFLMDQGKIAGVGNYILAEGLYRARIDPFADLHEISPNQRKLLFQELREVAFTSYAAQGLTRPQGGTYRSVDGSRGEFEFQLQCYGQTVSPNGNQVVKQVEGPHGRTIWFVPEEQLFMLPTQRFQYNINVDDEAVDTNKSSTKSGIKNNPSVSGSFTKDLCSQLKDQSWKDALEQYMESASFQSIATNIQSDIDGGATVYPQLENVFSAFNLCPLHQIKCVIVGQDPYHQPGQGHGLAFSVQQGIPPPPSLKNIFKEAMTDVGIESPQHGNLECWAREGVLLLNTVLTVRRGEANSHAKLGWEEFTDFVIQTINEQADSVVFMLWGSPAQKKAVSVDDLRHTVIRTSHPSPLGATKTKSPFIGSKCFSRANKALIDSGKGPIDWNVK